MKQSPIARVHWCVFQAPGAALLGCGARSAELEGGPSAGAGASAAAPRLRARTAPYLSAVPGGGGAVTVTAAWTRGCEHFDVYDTTNSQLPDGDVVCLSASNGQFLSADAGGGGALTATGPWMR